MAKKVKVVIFDKNLRGETGKYEISSKGSKISIRRGGKRNFNPSFTETSYLELPRLLGGYEKVYFVHANSNHCIDFKTENPEIHGPDPQQAEEATKSSLIRNFGKEEKGIPWYVWAIMGLEILILLFLMQ